jgi:hypothetical protein
MNSDGPSLIWSAKQDPLFDRLGDKPGSQEFALSHTNG